MNTSTATMARDRVSALNAEILRKEAEFDRVLEDSLVRAFQMGARWERRSSRRNGALSVAEDGDISPAGGGRERDGRESGTDGRRDAAPAGDSGEGAARG